MGGKSLKFQEPYACARDCKTPDGWDHAKRVGRGCTRPDLPAVSWDISAATLHAPRSGLVGTSLYMGRPPDPELEGTVDLGPVNHELPDEPSADGCPGGWYRTAFASSVLRYARRRTTAGGRVENGLLRTADDFIWSAVLEYELEQERAQAHADERARAIAQREAKRRSRGKGGARVVHRS